MPGIDKSTGRVVALVVLLLVVAASLRGYLPGAQQARRPQATADQRSLMFLAVLLTVSLGIVVFAFVVRLRDPRTAPPGPGRLFEMRGGGGGRPSWRVMVLSLAVLVAWLLVVSLLTRAVPHDSGQFVPPTDSPAPRPGSGTAQPPPPERPDGSGAVLTYLGASSVILLLLLTAGIIVTSRRRLRPAPPPVTDDDWRDPCAPPAPAESLARAAELGLAEIGDLNREPREAIIACYAAMERELAHVPGAAPEAFDTPTEVLVRAVEHQVLHADNAARLVNLYEEARFSPHVMNERHREIAEDVLRLVLVELRSVA